MLEDPKRRFRVSTPAAVVRAEVARRFRPPEQTDRLSTAQAKPLREVDAVRGVHQLHADVRAAPNYEHANPRIPFLLRLCECPVNHAEHPLDLLQPGVSLHRSFLSPTPPSYPRPIV
jgi:hypothetical protein